jgi:hypothetical protein
MIQLGMMQPEGSTVSEIQQVICCPYAQVFCYAGLRLIRHVRKIAYSDY